MNSTTATLTIRCKHEKTWPPAYAFQGVPLAIAREKMEHDEIARAEAWEKQCHKTKMDDACVVCPHVYIPVLHDKKTSPQQRKKVRRR